MARKAIKMKEITTATGVELKVNPLCLPCSGERTVVIVEGIGNIIDGIRAILLLTNENRDSTGTKPYMPRKI